MIGLALATRGRYGARGGPVPAPSYAATVLADAPVLYWRLDTTTGDALDSSGNGLDTAVPGFSEASRSVPGPLLSEATTAFACDGTDRVVYRVGTTAATLGIGGTGAKSFTCWIKPGGVGITYTGVWEVGTKVSGNYLALCRTEGDEGNWSINTYGPNIAFAGPPDGAWAHVAVTYDPGLPEPLKVYVDTELRLSSATVVDLGDAIPFAVGSLDLRYFVGDVGEVAVFDSALSPARIAAHHQAAGY